MNKTALRYGLYSNQKEKGVKKKEVSIQPPSKIQIRKDYNFRWPSKLPFCQDQDFRRVWKLQIHADYCFRRVEKVVIPAEQYFPACGEGDFFIEKRNPIRFLLPLPPDRSYSVRRTYLKIKRCAFFVYGNLRNFHCMQRQHSGLHVYVRGAAVYLHTKVSQDLHRQIVHSLTLSFYKPLLFLGLGERGNH